MIGLALVWLSQVPFRLVEVWWDRRYDQAEAGYLEALFVNWFALGAEFLFICLALVIVMALAGGSRAAGGSARRPPSSCSRRCSRSSRRTSSSTRARRRAAAARGRAPLRRASRGPTAIRVDVEDVSRVHERTERLRGRVRADPADRPLETRCSTAASPTARCGSCSPTRSATTRAATSRRGSRWYALFAFPGAYLIARFTRRRGGMASPAAVPLSLFVARRALARLAAAAERDLAPPGGGGRLDGARDDQGRRVRTGARSATSPRRG